MPFSNLGLNQRINKVLKENTYKNPTSIQEKVIPLILQKKDIMAKAQTGSGKTASFV
ncbi:MAG: DEAD/DEAH box helicase, partial [Aliarcobacter sp.]